MYVYFNPKNSQSRIWFQVWSQVLVILPLSGWPNDGQIRERWLYTIIFFLKMGWKISKLRKDFKIYKRLNYAFRLGNVFLKISFKSGKFLPFPTGR